jgi:PKD repeat protein
MRGFERFTRLVAGLAVMLFTIPCGLVSAQGLGLNAKFSWLPSEPNAGEPVQFVNESDGSYVLCLWDFDDGTTSGECNPEHTFDRGNVYEVRLTVWNARAEKDDETEFVRVSELEKPNARFYHVPESPVVGEEVQFGDESTGNPTVRLWDFDDGTTSTEIYPIHVFNDARSYEVKLTVSNSAGSDDEVVVVRVSPAVQAPTADFVYIPIFPVAGQVVRFFDASGGGTAGSWEWDFGDGGSSDAQFAEHIYESEGDYDVTFTVANSGGSDEATKTVSVSQESFCEDLPTALCLGNRFKVEVTWRDQNDATGVGQAIQLTKDTGVFWFFNAENLEMELKVINGCPSNNHFWVFAGGLTNVEVNMTVTDMATGVVRTYQNPLRTPFQPIQDTGAFATCDE